LLLNAVASFLALATLLLLLVAVVISESMIY